MHSETNAEVGKIMYSAIICGYYLALDTSVSESARNNYAVNVGKNVRNGFVRYGLRVYPFYLDVRSVNIACMAKCLGNRKICVVKLDVFADNAYRYRLRSVSYAFEHLVPIFKVDVRRINAEFAANKRRKMLLFKHNRSFIKNGKSSVFYNAVRLDVAEHRDFFED